MEHPDHDLIIQFNQGDAGAYTAIYNKYFHTLYFFVRRFVPEKEDAEDITAEIFLKLWRLRANLESVKNIEAFLYITARNACLDFLRHLKRQSEKEKELVYTLLQQPPDSLLKDDVKTEVLKAIQTEMTRLPPSCRRVFEMAYMEGRSNEEIAETMQINNQSVRNHKQRAIKLLRLTLHNRNILAGAMIWLYLAVLRVIG